MEHYVKDRVVLVTGGSSGFGLESARLVLEMGAKGVIMGRDAACLKKAEADLGKGGNVLAVRADAVRTPDWKRLIDTTVKTFGCLDVLINNHGAGGKIAEVENMDDASIGETIDVNLSGVIKGCRAAVRAMKPRGKGLIVNVSSACARHAWPSWAVYTAAKAGLVNFTRCLCVEMAKWGGRATFFNPGAARTNFCTPSMFACWVLASGVAQLVSRLFSGSGSFEDTAAVLGFGIGIATWSSLVHDLTDAALGALGVIDMRQYERALNEPTVWCAILWALYSIYLAWFILLFSKGMGAAHKTRRGSSLLMAITAFIIYKCFFLVFNR